ncbi:DNA methyltransferase [Mycobacteroides abscessus]|uniref:DNA methyltransferase n=1 Tax=Mycobacteroides abscessus TaxID=36809 RepID=UPI00026832BD|nr:DNA methyltransferase [Mycobacteroides abscessus]EIT93612.1 methyltransferase [Mycobacteroides abscessus 4S-0726-RA]EIU00638.1 methyltransferase [Mycobacteroides abscessus 4S-0303]EIU01640.1 methyltransferase [Mycobacteroides abscessus 4S-0726-RB]EIV15404.1 methyltransferase [Mycobacteroides abscessus 4S-0206]EIV52943.1 methyltransferase [Mycobacteroides abscessus 4S-0116-R]
MNSQQPLPWDEPTTSGRKKPSGEATNDVVLSSHWGDNAPVFRDILRLFVPEGSTVADVTWGKGAFWKLVPEGKYKLLATDIQMGVDCRQLPYENGSLDALVLDPPYMEGLFRQKEDHMAGSGSHAAFRASYSDGKATKQEAGAPKYHDAVLDLYYKAGQEAKRTLRNYGIFIVKCQDEVSANIQRLTHVELINHWAEDFYCKDLFVVTRSNRPGIVRLLKQEHARKAHSYFLVFVKRNPEFPKRIRPTAREARLLGLEETVRPAGGTTNSSVPTGSE